jgi:phospholipid/cholesterol/gamma-HCH transport system ATP-binding protein
MIQYRQVFKSFGDRPVLRGIDLEIAEGETFFILGKTGAGKTVMIRMLVGLVRPDRGQVLIDGRDVAGFGEEEFVPIRRQCGMVFQLPTLFDSLTVFDNVAFGLRRLGTWLEDEIRDRVFTALEQVELAREVSARRPSELSFGEQKRVGLARTLVLAPRYMLYDEPTTGLDPFTAGRITALIREVNRSLKATGIVVSHDLESMAEIADRVGLLTEGGFGFIGTVDEFMRNDLPAVTEFRRGFTRSSQP